MKAHIALGAALLLAGTASAAPIETRAVALPEAASPHYNAPPNATKPIALPCDRACMEALADRFMKAMAAHDPLSLPLAGTVRYTEMGQELAACSRR
jgi:hypothetical protein